jgi:hypothetical protein
MAKPERRKYGDAEPNPSTQPREPHWLLKDEENVVSPTAEKNTQDPSKEIDVNCRMKNLKLRKQTSF